MNGMRQADEYEIELSPYLLLSDNSIMDLGKVRYTIALDISRPSNEYMSPPMETNLCWDGTHRFGLRVRVVKKSPHQAEVV